MSPIEQYSSELFRCFHNPVGKIYPEDWISGINIPQIFEYSYESGNIPTGDDFRTMDIKNTGFSKDFINEVVKRTIKNRIKNKIKKHMRQKRTWIILKNYGIETGEFYQNFLVGNQGDDMDFSNGRHPGRCIKTYLKKKGHLLRQFEDNELF